jgi:hypothetical protein
MAAVLATWKGEQTRAAAWRARAVAVQAPFAAFWDPKVGAFSDTTADPNVHPLDGNVFALLAGLAAPAQQRSAIAFLHRALTHRHGDTIVDSNAWDGGEGATAAGSAPTPSCRTSTRSRGSGPTTTAARST